MGDRKSGIFRITRREVEITFCDVCGKDIDEVSVDGKRTVFYPLLSLEIEHRRQTHYDDQPEVVEMCSYECLEKFAKKRRAG